MIRSSTWDGSGSGKIADEIKKISTIRWEILKFYNFHLICKIVKNFISLSFFNFTGLSEKIQYYLGTANPFIKAFLTYRFPLKCVSLCWRFQVFKCHQQFQSLVVFLKQFSLPKFLRSETFLFKYHFNYVFLFFKK